MLRGRAPRTKALKLDSSVYSFVDLKQRAWEAEAAALLFPLLQMVFGGDSEQEVALQDPEQFSELREVERALQHPGAGVVGGGLMLSRSR